MALPSSAWQKLQRRSQILRRVQEISRKFPGNIPEISRKGRGNAQSHGNQSSSPARRAKASRAVSALTTTVLSILINWIFEKFHSKSKSIDYRAIMLRLKAMYCRRLSCSFLPPKASIFPGYFQKPSPSQGASTVVEILTFFFSRIHFLHVFLNRFKMNVWLIYLNSMKHHSNSHLVTF